MLSQPPAHMMNWLLMFISVATTDRYPCCSLSPFPSEPALYSVLLPVPVSRFLPPARFFSGIKYGKVEDTRWRRLVAAVKSTTPYTIPPTAPFSTHRSLVRKIFLRLTGASGHTSCTAADKPYLYSRILFCSKYAAACCDPSTRFQFLEGEIM